MRSAFSKFQQEEGSEEEENEEEYDSQSANSKAASSRRSKRALASSDRQGSQVKEVDTAMSSDKQKCPIKVPSEEEAPQEEEQEQPVEEVKEDAPAKQGEFEETKGGKKLTEYEKIKQMMERRQQMQEKAATTKASNFTAAQAARKAAGHDQGVVHEHKKSPSKHDRAAAKATTGGDKKKKDKKTKKHHKKGKKDKEEEEVGLQRQFSFGDDSKKQKEKPSNKKVFKFSDETSDAASDKQAAQQKKKETLKPKLKKAAVTPPDQKKKSAFAAAADDDYDEEDEEEDDERQSQSSGSVTAKLQAPHMDAVVPPQVRGSVAKAEVDLKDKQQIQKYGTESQLLPPKGQLEPDPKVPLRVFTNTATHGSSQYLSYSNNPEIQTQNTGDLKEFQNTNRSELVHGTSPQFRAAIEQDRAGHSSSGSRDPAKISHENQHETSRFSKSQIDQMDVEEVDDRCKDSSNSFSNSQNLSEMPQSHLSEKIEGDPNSRNAPFNPTKSRAPKNMTEIINSDSKRDSQLTHSSGLSGSLMAHRPSIMPSDIIFGTQAIIQSKMDPRQGKHSGSKFGNHKSKHHGGGDKDTRSVHSKKKLRPAQKSSNLYIGSVGSSKKSLKEPKKKRLGGERSGGLTRGNSQTLDIQKDPKKQKKRRNSHSYKTKNAKSRFEGNINQNDEDIIEDENEVTPQNKKKKQRKLTRFRSVFLPAQDPTSAGEQFEDHLTQLANIAHVHPPPEKKKLILPLKDPSTPSSDDVRTIDFDERAILMQSQWPKSMVDISSSQQCVLDKNSTFYQRETLTPKQREQGLNIAIKQSCNTVGEKSNQRTSSQNLSGLANIPKKACYTSCFSFNCNSQSNTSKSQGGGFIPPALLSGLAGEVGIPLNGKKRKRSNSGNNWLHHGDSAMNSIQFPEDEKTPSEGNPEKPQIGNEEGWITSFPAVFEHGLSAKINQKVIEESHPLTDMTPTNTNMSHYSDNFHHMQHSRMEDEPHYGVSLNAFGEPSNPVTEDRYNKEKARAQSILHVDQDSLMIKPPNRQESMKVRRLSGYQKSDDSNVESSMSLQIQQRNIISIQSTNPVKLIEASNRIHSAKMAAIRAQESSDPASGPDKWKSNILTEDASSEAVNTRSNNNSNKSNQSKKLQQSLKSTGLNDQMQKSRALNMQIPQPAVSSQSLREMTEEEKNLQLPRSPPTSDRALDNNHTEEPTGVQPGLLKQTTFGKHSVVNPGKNKNRFIDDNDYSDYNSESASKNSRPDASSGRPVGSGRSDNRKSISSQSEDVEDDDQQDEQNKYQQQQQAASSKNTKSQFKHINQTIHSSESESESDSSSMGSQGSETSSSGESGESSSSEYYSEESDYESSNYSSDASSSENSQKKAYIQMLEQKYAKEIQKEKKPTKPEGEEAVEMSADELQARSNEKNRMMERNILKEWMDDPTIPHYPSMIEETPDYKEAFLKSFGVVIGKKLKKKLSVLPNLEELQLQFKKSEANANKKTLILSGDDCILKTDLYKDQLPRVDGKFRFMSFDILICLRPFLKEFLYAAQKHFEIILWTSSQDKYTEGLVQSLQESLDFKFDQVLSSDQQTPSEEKEFTVKNIEVLTGLGGRIDKDIVMIDTTLEAYTNRLTNGIFVPTQKLLDDDKDIMLKILLKYIGSFVIDEGAAENFDVRNKIKVDFGLLEKFNGFKQSQAFLKIKRTLEEVMGEGEEEAEAEQEEK